MVEKQNIAKPQTNFSWQLSTPSIIYLFFKHSGSTGIGFHLTGVIKDTPLYMYAWSLKIDAYPSVTRFSMLNCLNRALKTLFLLLLFSDVAEFFTLRRKGPLKSDERVMKTVLLICVYFKCW